MTVGPPLPATIAEAADGVRTGRRSARDLVAACLARIEATDGELHGFISLRTQAALAEATAIDRRAEAGDRLPPLAGIPISVKDVIDVAGIATTAASRSQLGIVPDVDAPVVARLREAGAVVIGKANCHELSFGGPSFDLPFPPARNPWNRDFFPGGSSSGAGVTVAAGLCLGSIGTDTAGSVRLPATLCGIVGLKPGRGMCPLEGIRPLAPGMDSCGPLAGSAADVRALFAVMRGSNPSHTDAAGERLRAGDWRGRRIGVPGKAWGLESRLHPDVASAFEEAASVAGAAGAEIVVLDLPPLEDLHATGAVVMMAEVADGWSEAVRAAPDRFGRVFRGRALLGEAVPPRVREAANCARAALSRRVAAAVAGVDGLLMPGAFAPAVELADVATFYFLADPILNIVANLADLPALAFPAGLSGAGLPVGLQVLGSAGSEDLLIDLAEGYERLKPDRRARPPGFGPHL